MKSNKKNSLNTKIWLYLAIFSLFILLFLWVFQIIFLSSYYEWRKTKDIKQLVKQVVTNYNTNDTDDFYDNLEKISFENGVCIELTDKNNTIPYSNNGINRECIKGMHAEKYKNDFINSKQLTKKYTIINPQFENKTLIYGIHLDDSLYAYISTSLVPINSTVSILQSQFIYVTLIVLILALIISYFISKKLSQPIEEITISAKELAKGNYDAEFKTSTDIIEIQELTDTLNSARIELGKTDELRRDLMANVSHDLKTPLTMIKAYAEMVRDLTYKDKTKRENNLNTIIEEVDRLNALVNDILSLSVAESKMLVLDEETFNLTELIQTIIKHYEIFTTTLEYKFIVNTNDDIMIYADKAKIEQVIYNLINNAINYTGNDKTIFINIITSDNEVKVEITDTGKGIDDDEANLIWDKYYRSKKNHKRNTVGTGLGLAIVKRILELHNFEYGVVSKKNKGTTFYFIYKK